MDISESFSKGRGVAPGGFLSAHPGCFYGGELKGQEEVMGRDAGRAVQ